MADKCQQFLLEKKMKKLVLALAIVLSFPAKAHADQPISLLQTLCIPEKGTEYFSVDVKTFQDAAMYINLGNKGSPASEADRIKVLGKYGLIYPREFSYTCDLGKHKYTISGSQPEGDESYCAGDPRLVLSLKEDDTFILKGVFMEPSCYGPKANPSPYITSFSIEDGEGRGSNNMMIKYSDGTKTNDAFLNGMRKPITEADLKCASIIGHFETEKSTAKKEKCSK